MQFGNCGIELEREWFLSPTAPKRHPDTTRLSWVWYFFTLDKNGKRNYDECFRVFIWEFEEDFQDKHILLEDIDNAMHSISYLLKVYEKTGYKCMESEDLIFDRVIDGVQYSEEEFNALIYDKEGGK